MFFSDMLNDDTSPIIALSYEISMWPTSSNQKAVFSSIIQCKLIQSGLSISWLLL